MPRYVYRCDNCEKEFQTVHSIKDILTICELCNTENSLIRIPQMTMTTIKNKKEHKKVGLLVNKYIEDARTQLKQSKEEMSNRESK